MNPGTFRHPIVIERVTETRSPSGGVAEGEPETICEAWASIRPLSGRELMRAGIQPGSETVYEIRTWYRPEIRETDRVLWGGRTLEIDSVIDDGGLGRELVITATETRP